MTRDEALALLRRMPNGAFDPARLLRATPAGDRLIALRQLEAAGVAEFAPENAPGHRRWRRSLAGSILLHLEDAIDEHLPTSSGRAHIRLNITRHLLLDPWFRGIRAALIFDACALLDTNGLARLGGDTDASEALWGVDEDGFIKVAAKWGFPPCRTKD